MPSYQIADNELFRINNIGNDETLEIPEGVEYILNNDKLIDKNNVKHIIIPSTLKSIPSIFKVKFKKLESIRFKDTQTKYRSKLQNIEDYACACLFNLRHVDFPHSLERIGAYAFASCSLESVLLDKKVKEIKEHAFSNNKELAYVRLPEYLTKLELGIFSGCESLEAITIPKYVEEIQYLVFENCKNLRNINFETEKIKTIPDLFISNNIKMCEFIIPESVTKVESSAFKDCKNLKTIKIPNNLDFEKIEGCTFDKANNFIISKNNNYSKYNEPFIMNKEGNVIYTCNDVKKIVIPKEITKIKNFAFSNLEELEEIRFEKGSKISEIEESAFYYCPNLKIIEFPDNLKQINMNTLFSNKNLKIIKINKNTKEIINSNTFSHPDCKILYNGTQKELENIYGIEDFININKIKKIEYEKTLDELIDEGRTFREASNILKNQER